MQNQSVGATKKKNRKLQSRKRPSKPLPPSKQRTKRFEKQEPPARTPWLQILSEDVEEDQTQATARNRTMERNGRRASPEMNLYVAERNPRGIRKFR